jgi:hypothetical protein
MRGITDLRVLWGIGAVMIVFCSIGLLAAATVFAVPFYVGALILGASDDAMIKAFLYSAALWAPIGVGAGAVGSTALVKGIRRRRDPQSAE